MANSSSPAPIAASVASKPRIAYRVAMPQPESHLFEVTIEVEAWPGPVLDLHFPVWTPGSYLVREYARHVQNFRAEAGGIALPWHKRSKNRWRVESAAGRVTVRYQVFAHDLTVRTNHLDRSHGYFNPAATLFFVPGHRTDLTIAIEPPQGWIVTTALAEIGANCYRAEDFDQLVDSPFEIGQQQVYEFEALGIPHRYVVYGEGDFDAANAIADTRKIIQAEAEIFGGLPYDRYFFLLHLNSNGYGGLEHKDCCSLIYSRFGFGKTESYQNFLQLVAHEFFHLWNIKRIRPKGLEVFDYEQENYTPSLWFSEGTTSYYDMVIPFRAGIYDAAKFLTLVSKDITRLQTTIGRQVQPLAESSFDAWIKLYRRDAHSDNNQISYYLKGELVTFLLDLIIRDRHQNQRSFDQVLQQLWVRFGKDEVGFEPEDLTAIIEEIAGVKLDDFWAKYLENTEELPFDQFLEPFGLGLEVDRSTTPDVGLQLQSDGGLARVKSIVAGGAAQRSGLMVDDVLLAINGWRVSADKWGEMLDRYGPGDEVRVDFFHDDGLMQTTIRLDEGAVSGCRIVPIVDPSESQKAAFKGWLKVGLDEVFGE
jgi:predicted metalloprotease with PDZ domain